MNSSQLKTLSLLLILTLSCACEKGKNTTEPTVVDGSALFHYQQRALTKDRRQKLLHINKGLEVLEDTQDTLYVDLLRHKAINHYYLDDLDSTALAATHLINAAKKDKDDWNAARGHFFRGWALKELGENEASFKDSFRAKELFLQLMDSAYAGRAYFNMAVVQQNSGDYAGAQQNATETLRLLDPKKDSSFVSAIHNEIGRSLFSQRLYKDAIQEYQIALNLSTTANNTIVQVLNVATTLGKLEREEEAIDLLENLLINSDLLEGDKIKINQNLAFLKWKKKPSIDISVDLEKAYQFFKKQGDTRNLMIVTDFLGSYYGLRAPTKSFNYAREQLALATEYGNPQARLDALKSLVKLSKHEESKDFTLEYMRLTDSLSQARMRMRNLFAKIQYDEEQKELEILGLQTMNARQDAEIAVQRQGLILMGSVAVIIILGGGFIFYYFKLKHRREKLQQVFRTEARIAKKVHDELANDIYIVMTQLEGKASSQWVDKLEDIYERTRDISRENSKVRTGSAFGPELLGMLRSYMPSGTRLLTPGFDQIPWKALTEEKQLVVFRSLQELMTNMKKHSHAKVVVISFSHTNKMMVIRYADRGVGIANEDKKYKNGLQNVENRISAVAGIFTFESSLGEGVKANINLPI